MRDGKGGKRGKLKYFWEILYHHLTSTFEFQKMSSKPFYNNRFGYPQGPLSSYFSFFLVFSIKFKFSRSLINVVVLEIAERDIACSLLTKQESHILRENLCLILTSRTFRSTPGLAPAAPSWSSSWTCPPGQSCKGRTFLFCPWRSDPGHR